MEIKSIVKNLAIKTVVTGLNKGLIGGAKAAGGGVVSKVGTVVQGVMVAKNIYKESANVFLDTKKKAKMAGKMLACALAMSYPFES